MARSIRGLSVCTRRIVNALPMMRRSLVWSGGSLKSMLLKFASCTGSALTLLRSTMRGSSAASLDNRGSASSERAAS